MQQLAGHSVIGFRAPRFSLTPQTTWALDILAELGFRYSSSIMPTDVSLFGFPDASREAFDWPQGLREFPLPVAQLGKYRLPYLGGIYLTSTPFFLIRHWVNQASRNEVLWTYTHPYDFDNTEKFAPLPNTPLWVSLVLWLAQQQHFGKIRRVLELGNAPPLRERL